MTFDVIKLKKTESTNTYAKALLKSGESCAPFTLVYTDVQTAGRGRLGRIWESKEGDTLCMSLIAPYPHNPAVTLLAAVGVLRALSALTDENIRIKWPNDLIFESKKLCGILTESTEKYAVIGIGINLNTQSFSKDIAHKATSLKLITNITYDSFEVSKLVAQKVVEVLEETKGVLTLCVLKEYSALCANLGREIIFRGKKGIAAGIAPDGSLVAETPEGTEHINSGEVTVSGIY